MDPVVVRVERLEREFAALCLRLEALEPPGAAVADASAEPAEATATACTPHLPGADLTPGDSSVAAPIGLAPASEQRPSPVSTPTPASRAQPAPTARGSLEDQLGGEWLNWLGVGISILAVGFALKWGYDRGVFQGLGTLSAPVRLGLGWALGVCLLLAGERMWRELSLYAQGLLGAGIAVLHVTTHAGHGYFHVLPAAAATLILAGVNALAIGLAVRRDAVILLWLGIIFAYVGPLVLGSDRVAPASLFLYVTALNGTILGVSFYRRWVGLRLAAFCAAALLYGMWLSGGYSAPHAPAALWFVGLNTLVFLGVLVAGPIRRGDVCDHVDLPLAVLTPVLAVPALLQLLNALGHPHPGWALFLLAALYWSAARLVRVRCGAGDYLEQLLFGVALALEVVAIPVQFSGRLITAGWALGGAALMGVGWRAGSGRTLAWGIISLCLAVLRLFVEVAFQMPGAVADPVWNARTLSFAIVAGSLLVGAGPPALGWFRRKGQEAGLLILAVVLIALADGWASVSLAVRWQAAGCALAAGIIVGACLGLQCRNLAVVGWVAVSLPAVAAALGPLSRTAYGDYPLWEWLPSWLVVAFLSLLLGSTSARWSSRAADRQRDVIWAGSVLTLLFATAGWRLLAPHHPWLCVAGLGWVLGVLAVAARCPSGGLRALAAAGALLLLSAALGNEMQLSGPLLLHPRAVACLCVLCAWRLTARAYARTGLEPDTELSQLLNGSAAVLGLAWLTLEAHDLGFRLASPGWEGQAAQFAISALWALCGTACAVRGLGHGEAPLRLVGLALLLGTAGKTLLLDLAFLGIGFRVVSCAAVGAALLGVSYLYQKRRT